QGDGFPQGLGGIREPAALARRIRPPDQHGWTLRVPGRGEVQGSPEARLGRGHVEPQGPVPRRHQEPEGRRLQLGLELRLAACPPWPPAVPPRTPCPPPRRPAATPSCRRKRCPGGPR